MYSARGNSTYTFSNVTRQDNGTTFRCGAAGVISNTVTVRVIVPPKISGRTGPYTILEGSSRTLTYQVTGNPFPHSLLWFYNGQPFTGNERITIIRNSSLAIRAASRHDSGNYTFIVTSRYEKQDSISLELLVAGRWRVVYWAKLPITTRRSRLVVVQLHVNSRVQKTLHHWWALSILPCDVWSEFTFIGTRCVYKLRMCTHPMILLAPEV